jgi:2-amino-4-hydroxy-6-hydroxymethyldihydropteridine diphosphokinase
MTNTFHQVCILLGSNILPEIYLPQAIAQLGQGILISRISSIWETKAVGSSGPNFLNAALLGYSQLQPARLKTELLRPLEADLGRVRTHDKNAPRTIDLDIVVFDQHPIDQHLWKYAHAAVPVAELLPGIVHPVTGVRLQQAAEQLAHQTVITRRSDLSMPVAISLPSSEQDSLLMPHSGSYVN